ncbi:hypothetical protein J1614_011104 [Plenodomus biglobosus]|nr:hypothetical protein J1614_011104 [Plenodomus biglobosus]
MSNVVLELPRTTSATLRSAIDKLLSVMTIDTVDFTSILSSCQVLPTNFPVTNTALPSAVQPTCTSGASNSCWGGEKYTVKQGDTCESVAAANGMAIDRRLHLNGIDFHYNAFGIDRPMCIRDACNLHIIKSQESCKDIIDVYGFTKLELIQWNPILETGCDNTTAMAGRPISITPPGTDKYDFSSTASWNNTWTWPAGNSAPGPMQGTPLTNQPTTWDIPTITAEWTANVNPNLVA